MKLFNMGSPKFGKRAGTNMQLIEMTNVYSIDSTKKKKMVSTSTPEFLEYPWSSLQCVVL
jgi:hypothetical protein